MKFVLPLLLLLNLGITVTLGVLYFNSYMNAKENYAYYNAVRHDFESCLRSSKHAPSRRISQ